MEVGDHDEILMSDLMIRSGPTGPDANPVAFGTLTVSPREDAHARELLGGVAIRAH